MKKVRILFLDSGAHPQPEPLFDGVEIEWITVQPDYIWGGYNELYLAEWSAKADSTPTQKAIVQRGLSEVLWKVKVLQKDVDLIVIGNNLGTGMSRADALDGDARRKTIIVWNDLPPQEQNPYIAMGFAHFSRRRGVERMIRTILGL